jgi:hypothetical protein
MNWEVNKTEPKLYILPAIGDKKKQRRFAFLPVKVECGFSFYWVWLEYYTVVKQYKATLPGTDENNLGLLERWVVIKKELIINL